MANIQHSTLTDPELHEPIGCAAASEGTAYVADGLGSGAWVYPGCHIYGNIYSKDGSVAISTIGTTPKKLAAFTANGPYNGTTPDHTNDQITVLTAGDYYISFELTFATAAAGDAGLYQYHLRVNGTENAALGLRKYQSGTTDTDSVGFHGVATLAANDVLTVYVESDEAGLTDDIIVEAASLTCMLLKAA